MTFLFYCCHHSLPLLSLLYPFFFIYPSLSEFLHPPLPSTKKFSPSLIMSAISSSTSQETRSVFLLSYSSDRSHLTFRLDPRHTPSYDELKHAVLNEVIKQFHEKRYKSLDQGHDEQKSSVLSRRDGEKESIILEKDQERFLEFVGIQPDTAKTILEEHDRKLEKLRVSYNSLHQSLSFVVKVTFTHDVHISWITHAIGMACFEQKLTPAELNLLEVGSTARELGNQRVIKCLSPVADQLPRTPKLCGGLQFVCERARCFHNT